MRFLLYAILFYLAYQFIFNLVIPLFKTGRQIKKGFKEMHQRMNEQFSEQQPPVSSSASDNTKTKTPAKDYIDFEEIK
jgi:hypothetical protein